MTNHPPIPEDDDIRRMRHRAAYATRFSQDRRRAQTPVRDTASTTLLILAAIATLVIALAASTVGATDAPASPEIAGKPAETPRGLVDVPAERIMRAWCPAPRAMSRRVCVRWLRVAQCETGDPADVGVTAESMRRIRWRYNGASGYDGALQFGTRTWRGNIGRVASWRLTLAQRRDRAMGVYRYAYGAPPAVQMLTADELRRRPGGGLGHWPRCGARWYRL